MFPNLLDKSSSTFSSLVLLSCAHLNASKSYFVIYSFLDFTFVWAINKTISLTWQRAAHNAYTINDSGLAFYGFSIFLLFYWHFKCCIFFIVFPQTFELSSEVFVQIFYFKMVVIVWSIMEDPLDPLCFFGCLVS